MAGHVGSQQVFEKPEGGLHGGTANVILGLIA